LNTIKPLTSLRYFAALAVFLFHLKFTVPSLYKGDWFQLGGLGVGFFFMLSGYVLGLRYGGDRQFSLSEYAAKRFARVYPLHLITFATWNLVYFSAWGNSLIEKYDSGIANVFLLHALFAGPIYQLGFNAVSWSISCEFIFYSVFPLIRRPAAAAACASVISLAILSCWFFAYSGSLLSWYSDFFYFNPIPRMAEFAAGVLISLTVPRLQTRWATVLEIGSLGLLAGQLTLFGSIPQELREIYLIPGFGAVIAAFGCQSGIVSRILGHRNLVVLGDASYGFYLWHHMILRSLGDHLSLRLQSLSPFGKIFSAFLILVGITVFAVASYRWIELPMRALALKATLRRQSTPASRMAPQTV